MYMTKKKAFGTIAAAFLLALACCITVLAAEEETEYVPVMAWP